MSARLICHKRMQPDMQSRDEDSAERVIRMPGSETVCRFLCGPKEMGRAAIWRDDSVVFRQWRMQLDAATVKAAGYTSEKPTGKLVEGGSPRGLVKYLRDYIISRIDCSKV